MAVLPPAPLFAASSGRSHETWRHRLRAATRRTVAEVQGTQRLLACCCCAPFETQHQRAYRVSSETSRTHPPTYSTQSSSSSPFPRAALSIELIVIRQLEACQVDAGGLCFDLASVTRNTKICSPSLVICLYHETPLHGRLHKLEGSLTPIRHANYWSSRILRQSCLVQSVLSFILPPDESATPFSRQDKLLPDSVLARCGEMCIYECCISCMLSKPRVSNNDTNPRGWQNTMPPNVKLRKANAERYLLRAANGSFPHATLILSSCTPGCRQLTCAAACA